MARGKHRTGIFPTPAGPGGRTGGINLGPTPGGPGGFIPGGNLGDPIGGSGGIAPGFGIPNIKIPGLPGGTVSPTFPGGSGGSSGGPGGNVPGGSFGLGNNPNLSLRNNPYTAPQFYYPINLGSEGQEPYVIFDIRDGVAKDAKSKGTIALMLPNEIRAGYRAGYEDQQFGILGWDPIIPQSVGAALKSGIDSAISGALEIINHPINTIKSATQGAVNTARATAINASARAQRDLRTIVNPHMAVLFQGMGFRTFSMNFSLIARNVEESDMIRNIIYTFKYHMHPSLPPDDTTNRFLLYPENFVIAFMSPADDYLFKCSPCVLEAMDVDYNGSSVPAFYAETGAPVHINMSLQFKETEVLTKERIAEGL